METEKITAYKIYEQVATLIKKQIVEGKYQPGEKLPSTRELSERYQVGRSTVREALSALKAMGLVETHQGEGSYVRTVTGDDMPMPNLGGLLMDRETVMHLIEARKALETANASIAAEKRTEADLVRFEHILNRMRTHLGDEAEGEKADMQFHLTLVEATHNSIMVRLLETISSQMEMAIRETRRLQMYANKSVSAQLWREHQEIFEAVKAQEPQLAQEKMKQHLFHVERMLIRFLPHN